MNQLLLAKNLLLVATIGLLLSLIGTGCSGFYVVRNLSYGGCGCFSTNAAFALCPLLVGLVQFTLAVCFRAYTQACVEQQILQALAVCGGPIYRPHELT